jgi:hypothetical protein
MANDDRARSNHSQDMPSIEPPVFDERVMRVDVAQNGFVSCVTGDLENSLAEDAWKSGQLLYRLQQEMYLRDLPEPGRNQ